MKIRSRKFVGRCPKHKGYNPPVDGQGGVRGACARCTLLFEIWEASLQLNRLIRRFDPQYDDLKKLEPTGPGPRQIDMFAGD